MRIIKCDGCFKERGKKRDDWQVSDLTLTRDNSVVALDLCPTCLERLEQSLSDELESIQKEARGIQEYEENNM